MDESTLIKKCLKGNPKAQKLLFDRYSSKMLGVCLRYAKNTDQAYDFLQEGFIKVFTQIHTFQNKGSFEGWIRRIMVHTSINFLKKYKKFTESLDLTSAENLEVKEESIASIMQSKQVVECIRLLPIGYKTVLNLFAIEGYSHREISILLDIEESTSRSQYTRAKNMLSNILIKKRIIEAPKEKFELLSVIQK